MSRASGVPVLPPVKGAPSRFVVGGSVSSTSSTGSSSSCGSSGGDGRGQAGLEDELTNSKLKTLQAIFEEADEDGGGGLDMEEFRIAMRHTMGDHVSDEEMDRIFMKVDTNCDGTVDWDEYLTYMLLECREKDSMNIQARRPFPRDIRHMQGPHRDSVVRILVIPNITKTIDGCALENNRGRYLSISREGAVAFWNLNFQILCEQKIEPPNPDGKSIWVTDFAILAYAHMVVISTTGRDLLFYDIGAKRFRCVSKVAGLESCATTMCAWSPANLSRENTSETNVCLVWGNAKGGIAALRFNMDPDKTALNPKQTQNANRRIHFNEILAGRVPHITAYSLPEIHNDHVRQVEYLHYMNCFLSCSRDTETAMYMGDFEQRIHHHYFQVTKGIYSFEYVASLNIIVSGGYDAIVRVWNPYVPSKAVIMLQGHKSPITHVQVDMKREYIISVAENKEIRVHDLNTQTCIQTFYRKMVPGMGPRPFTAVLFNVHRQSLVLGTTHLAVLEHREEDLRSQQMVSHSLPVTTVMYNPLFQQIVSVGSNSMVCVWHLFTGDKVMQFSAYKVRRNGITIDLEITAMSFDPTLRRLITAAREGAVKIWNFNNGACLRELPVYDRCEITSVVCPRERIITVGWNKRITIYVDSGEEDDTVQCLGPSHRDDIISAALRAPNLLASGSYDGDIMVWSLETGRLLHCLNARRGRCPFTPANGVKTGYYTPMDTSTDKSNAKKTNMTSAVHKPQPQAEPIDSTLLVSRITDTSTMKGQASFNGSEYKKRQASFVEEDRETIGSAPTPQPSSNSQGRPSSYSQRTTPSRSGRTTPLNNMRKSSKTNGQPVEAENIIEKLLFLQSRENLPNCATLLTSYSDGFVRAWSVHHNGGLLGEFVASHKRGHSIVSMATDESNIYLITGDTLGYIKVWDISRYCAGKHVVGREEQLQRLKLEHDKFPLMFWQKRICAMQQTNSWIKEVANDPTHPPLLTHLRGHLQAVTCVDFVHVNGKNFMLSGSQDCSIRLWTLKGEFIGIVGQKNLWNPMKRMDATDPKAELNSRYTYTKVTCFLPPDVRRSASAATLTCLNGGRRPGWMLARHVVTWLIKYSKGPLPFSPFSSKETAVTATEDSQDTPQEPRCTSSILGHGYRRTTRHHPLPSLPKIRMISDKISAYNSLPFVELEPVQDVEPPDIIKEIRQRAQQSEKRTISDKLPAGLRDKGPHPLMKIYRRISWMVGDNKKMLDPGSSIVNLRERRGSSKKASEESVSSRRNSIGNSSSGTRRKSISSDPSSEGQKDSSKKVPEPKVPSRSSGGAGDLTNGHGEVARRGSSGRSVPISAPGSDSRGLGRITE